MLEEMPGVISQWVNDCILQVDILHFRLLQRSFLIKKIKTRDLIHKYLDFKMNLIVFFHFLIKTTLPWKRHELENFSELQQLPEGALVCLFFWHQVLDAVEYSIPKTQTSVCVWQIHHEYTLHPQGPIKSSKEPYISI